VNDKLTRRDIAKMEEELHQKRTELMPELLEEVKRTRAFGDLSENYEYKAAKQALNRCKGRIRYLEGMIATAIIIDDSSNEGEIGLFDKVTIEYDDGEKQLLSIVTTVRTDPLNGLISREAPLGKALLGKKTGQTVHVSLDNGGGYDVKILSIEKDSDDGSAPLLQY